MATASTMPRDIPRILEALKTSGCEMVIGSRFVEANGWSSSFVRSLGIRFFRAVLRPILGQTVHDPTSGFVGVNRSALQVFSQQLPAGVSGNRGAGGAAAQPLPLRGSAVPDAAAHDGPLDHHRLKSLYYIAHVLLGVFVNVLKFERRAQAAPENGSERDENESASALEDRWTAS